MSQSDAPLALLLTQSDIPPEICAHLMLLLHQTLACTIELRSRVEQISCYVKGIDGTPLFALFDAYTDSRSREVRGEMATSETRR